MVPGARIELATPAFSGRRSTNELPRQQSSHLILGLARRRVKPGSAGISRGPFWRKALEEFPKALGVVTLAVFEPMGWLRTNQVSASTQNEGNSSDLWVLAET